MTIETRLRNTGQQGGGGGGAPSGDSGGLAGTGFYYLVGSNEAGLPASKVLSAGSSVTIHTDTTAFYINAITNAGSGSGGLMGTANFLVAWSSDPLLSNEKVLRAGSSVTIATDATGIYITAITSLFSGSGGLASTGGFFAVWSNDATLSNEKIITAGSSVTLHTDGSAIYINATTSVGGSSAGLAGTGSFYVTWLTDPALSNEKTLTAGSSVTLHTDASAVYINATTSEITAASGVSTGGFLHLPVQSAKLYGNESSARIDAGTPTWRLLYSQATQQYGIWQFVLPFDYSGNPGIQLLFSSDSSLAVAQSVSWIIEQWGYSDSQGSIYIDTYGGANTTAIALSAGYSAGLVTIITVPLVNSTSMVGGNLIKLRISSSAGNVTGNQELVGAGLYYRLGTQTIATGSGGLAGTGGSFVSWQADSQLSNEKTLTAGTSVSIRTDATTITIDSPNKDFNYWYATRANTGCYVANRERIYIAGQANALALGATIIAINSAHCVPFILTKDIVIDSMGFTATIAGSATCIAQVGIYSNSADNVLYPFQAIATSALVVSGTNTNYVGFNPNLTLTNNTLYWFAYFQNKSAQTLRTIAVGGAWPIFGLGTDMGTAPGLYISCPMAGLTSTGLPATISTSGVIQTTAVPALGVRVLR